MTAQQPTEMQGANACRRDQPSGSMEQINSHFAYSDLKNEKERTKMEQQNNRTIVALRDTLKGDVWIFLDNAETCRKFYEQAEAEGFHFGDILPTQGENDDIIALHHDRQLAHTGFAGHMRFYHGPNDTDFHRINYAKYIAGEDNFYFDEADTMREQCPKPDYIAAHKGSAQNETIIRNSNTCGYFYCLSIFPVEEIGEDDWTDDFMEERTALCPKCGIDSIIGDAGGYRITEELLKQMQKYWFWE